MFSTADCLMRRRRTGVSLRVADFIRKYSCAGGIIINGKWSKIPGDKTLVRSHRKTEV